MRSLVKAPALLVLWEHIIRMPEAHFPHLARSVKLQCLIKSVLIWLLHRCLRAWRSSQEAGQQVRRMLLRA
jgi:hypothetical protein